jgi:hypothetical protein
MKLAKNKRTGNKVIIKKLFLNEDDVEELKIIFNTIKYTIENVIIILVMYNRDKNSKIM